MAARANRPQLVAVDANVLFDLADGLDDVVDAVSVMRARLRDARFLIPPTVQHELVNWALRGDGQERESARKAIQLGQSWRIVPVNLIAVRQGIAERIAERLREHPLKGRLHDSRSVIMMNTFQFTRTTKLAWRFPKYTKDTNWEVLGTSGAFTRRVRNQ